MVDFPVRYVNVYQRVNRTSDTFKGSPANKATGSHRSADVPPRDHRLIPGTDAMVFLFGKRLHNYGISEYHHF